MNLSVAFGLGYRDNKENESFLRVYFDYLPDTLEKRQRFKEYIKGLQTFRSFQLANIKIRKQDIAEIDSKKHLLLQMLDVVLGSICFRLNNKHKLIPEGKKRRGKRTIAKEQLYKFIHSKICELRQNFNIGSSTGITSLEDRWSHPYRHWNFRPRDFEVNDNLFK